MKTGGDFDETLTRTMFEQKGGPDGGNVTLLRPDGTQYPGSPFTGGGLPGPWAAVVDGNDNVWISKLRRCSEPNRATLRRPHRELPAWNEDRRPDLAARWLCGWRPSDADRSRHRPGRECLGDEQLARHRQLLRHASRDAFDPLRQATKALRSSTAWPSLSAHHRSGQHARLKKSSAQGSPPAITTAVQLLMSALGSEADVGWYRHPSPLSAKSRH